MDDNQATQFTRHALYLLGDHTESKKALDALREQVMSVKLDGFAVVEEIGRPRVKLFVIPRESEYEWVATLHHVEGKAVLRMTLYRDKTPLAVPPAKDYVLPFTFDGSAFVGEIDVSIAPTPGHPLPRTDLVRVVLDHMVDHVVKTKLPA